MPKPISFSKFEVKPILFKLKWAWCTFFSTQNYNHYISYATINFKDYTIMECIKSWSHRHQLRKLENLFLRQCLVTSQVLNAHE